MPVCLIEGPTLTKESKLLLIENILKSLVDAYQMADDRVYINEFKMDNYGHTPIDSASHESIIQKEIPRIVITIIAPPGLPLPLKRTMFREITEAAGKIYSTTDLRDILTFLNEHPIENVAANGYIQTENPDFISPSIQK